MTKKQYTILRIITIIILCLILSYAFTVKSPQIAILSIILAMGAIFSWRKKTDIMYDERDIEIGGKAARFSITIFAVLGALISIPLMWQNPIYSNIYNVGMTLSISVCVILISYNIFYAYFSKK